MDLEFTARAQKDLAGLPPRVKAQAQKQLALLCENQRHPSIQAKKYEGTDDIWQGRVNRNYRFYFKIIESTYRILRITPHPK
jgi:mRNA-degrading endonuclease RelE of RelBE toxin-antitoxin system